MCKNFTFLRPLLVAMLLVLGIVEGRASHVLGAELTYRCLGTGLYEFSLTMYRDCDGITLPQSVTMSLTSASCATTLSTTLTQDTSYFLGGFCPGILTTCNGGQALGVEVAVFRGVFALTIPCADWVASYSECCRSATIANLTNAASQSMYVETRLNTFNQLCNNSATFDTDPTMLACTNTAQQFDLSATDIDGDSLVYSLIGARSAGNGFNPYQLPYNALNPFNSPTGVTLSPTGILSFTLPTVATCVYVVQVQEYRNGVLVGSVMRDISLIGTNCNAGNNPPVFGAAQVINGTVNGNTITVSPGNAVTITIPATDPDTNQIVTLSGAITQALPNAQVVFSPGSVQIFWTVPQGFQGAVLVLTATDNNCPLTASTINTWLINLGCSVVATGQGFVGCQGAPTTIQLAASAVGVQGGGTYQWSPAGAFADPNVANAVAIINAPTTFTVTYTEPGCTATATWTVGAQPLSLTAAITDAPLCGGNAVTVQLNATANQGGGTYSWSPAGVVANPGQATTTATISQPTTFEVVYTLNGCSDTATVQGGVQSYGLTTTPDQTICAGQTTQLTATLTGPAGGGNCNQYALSAVPHVPFAIQGTTVALTDDAVSAALPVGFSFPFFCNAYTTFRISSNGFIGFDAAMLNGCCVGQVLPNVSAPNNIIALAWADLNPGLGGTISYYTTGTAPNRRTVINFVSIRHYGAAVGGPSVTGQIVLHETTGIVDIFTTNIQNDGSAMTQGIENAAGTFGFAVNGRNGFAWTGQGDGWRFTPAAANTTYLWTPAAGLSNPNIANPVAAPAVTTDYIVFATGPNCTLSDTVTITVTGQAPQIDAFPDVTVCAGDTLSLDLTGANLANATIYWGNLNGQQLGQGTNLTFTPFQSQNVYVVANTGCGLDVDTFAVNVQTAPIFTLNDVQSQAPGAPVTLYVPGYPTPAYPVTWAIGGVIFGTTNPIVVSPMVTTTYTATVYSPCGNVSDDLTVFVPGGAPMLNPLNAPTCLNPGDSLVLEATGFNLAGATYAWYDGVGNLLSTSNPLVAFPQATSNYMLVATTAQGTDTATVTVNVGTVPVLNNYTPPTTCFGQTIALTMTGQNLNGASFQWYGPLQQPGFGQTYVFTPQTFANTFLVVAANACGSDTTSFVVYAFPPPVATIVLTGTDTLTAVATLGQAPYTFVWNTGATGNFITNLVPGVYYVTVTDASGCWTVADYVVTAPNYGFAVTVQNATCGNADGSAEVTNIQGFGQTSIAWSNGQTGAVATGLAAGGYSVTVTDLATGFAQHQNLTVTEDNACYATVSGYVYNDDLNQACDPAQAIGGIGSQLVHLIELDLYALTNGSGFYQFNVPAGAYTIEVLNGAGWDLLCPAAPGTLAVNAAVNGGAYANNNFFLTVNQIQDLTIHVVYGPARPGLSYSMTVTWCNYGTQAASGTATLTYPSLLQNLAATLVPTTNTPATHSMTWDFVNLLPGQCQSVVVYGTVPVPTPIGTPISGAASVTPVQGDISPSNNVYTWNQVVTAAYDPNYKVVDPQQVIPGQDSLLHYTVHYMNTGNDTAFTVVVRDTLDAQLDLSTLALGQSTHAYNLTIEGNNILVFTFNNIMLPDSGTNFAASQGYLQFDIELKPGMPNFMQVSNTAAIYFDFNAPIITNTVVTTALTGIHTPGAPAFGLSVMPNPTNGAVTVAFDRAVEGTLQVFDVQGRLVRTQSLLGDLQTEVDLSGTANGLYLIRVVNGGAVVTERVMKQD